MQTRLLPDDFDVSLIADGSALQPEALAALRRAALLKAKRDPIWFLENFWWVMDPETMQWTLFTLRDYQIEDILWILEALEGKRYRDIVGKARQVGMTTELGAMSVWDAMFHDNHPWLVVSQTEPDAQRTMVQRMKRPYLKLPQWMRDLLAKEHDVEKFLTNDNKESMEFANGSRIDSVVSTPNVARGDVVFGVIMDEAAHQQYADDVFTALDPLCYGPLFVISTGNGMGNFFHEKWVDSEMVDSVWRNRFHPWHVVPGRDDKWYRNEKLKYRGQEWRFYQEYPASPEEMFAKTGMAVLPIDLMREEHHWCPPNHRIDLDYGWDDKRGDWRVYLEEGESSTNELHVWEKPWVLRDEYDRAIQKPNYVIFCDTAEGLAHGDRTAIVVFDANSLEQVASYRGHYPIEDLGELLDRIGRWYYQALMMPERNNQGILPINHLHKTFEYPRLYRMAPVAQIQKSDRTPRFGWITSPATKAKMVFEFIKGLRDGQMLLHDSRILEEALTFVKNERGGFEASHNNYDDLIMTTMGGWQGVLEVGQYPITWIDDQAVRPITMGELIGLSDKNQRAPHPLTQRIGGGKPEKKTISWTF